MRSYFVPLTLWLVGGSGCHGSVDEKAGFNSASGSETTSGTGTGTDSATVGTAATSETSETPGSTGPQAQCGDGVAEVDELCDGADFLGETCVSLGFETGELWCDALCKVQTDKCQLCGNGILETGETCDAGAFGEASCQDHGFPLGDLQCSPDCSTVDPSACAFPECGDDSINQRQEVCDGTDVDGAECLDFDFATGTVLCAPDCTGLDLSDCKVAQCGDGIVNQGSELCDGADIGLETCKTQGDFGGGTLGCAGDCTYDTSDCCGGPIDPCMSDADCCMGACVTNGVNSPGTCLG